MKNLYKRIIVLAILLQLVSFAFMLPVQSQQTIPFAFTGAVWGQSLAAPVKVYPGDAAPFIVELQNLSPDVTIKGVTGVLMLDNTPFVDLYGGTNATAIGTPTITDILSPSDQVAPKGFFTFTFHLEVNEDAAPGTYILNLLVNYSTVSLLTYTDGIPQTLQVPCTVSPAQSTVTVSASPTSLESGDQVKLSGTIQPAVEDATVNLAFKDPLGNQINQTVKTKIDGVFNYSFNPEAHGKWTVNASWAGNAGHQGNWAAATFEVSLTDSLEVTLTNDRIKAGYDNSFNITVKNSGNLTLSTLDFTFTLPPPLVSVGKSHWTLNSLAPGKNYSIPVVVYAPFASIGNTISATFATTCQNEYGQSKNYNNALGLVIIGNVELGVYDNVVNPEVAINGSKIEITPTLLNKGTTPALYVNASILPNPILELSPLSSVYIGDVDENSQAPFTLSANVTKDAKAGTYPVTLRIDYRNDQNLDNSFNYTFNLEVAPGSQSEVVKNDFIGLPQLALVVVVIVVAACLMILVYRRQISKSKKNQGR